ncbi:F0F1 ATP synthase subunit delta [Sphingomonas profundi]|uniref:F0F1 ATP synthase subunit delta n=1 Tax=Alterirhizorhabdus profundi TaxID=2681549 RepID=UPI0012E8C419|nr:F0F1 ATP synthase subunit delta [Sphingomonas profundi]
METSGGIQASLSGRYATALFELARDERQLDTVSASLETLKASIAGSDELRRLIASPLIGRTEAKAAIAAVVPAMGLDPLTGNFLGVLAQNRRLDQIDAVIRAFRQLLARHRNEATADVTSAHPLGDDQIAALKAKLRQQTGRDVAIDLKVDPAILGGLIVKVGSRMVDGSIRTKLNTLATAMKG